jgi:hypothetical protein
MFRTGMVSAVCLAALLALPSAVGAEVVTNERIDFTGFTVFVPCANGGAGELVTFEGPLHVLIAVTLDKAGGFHLKEHSQPQGLTGVGADTGDKYQGTGVTQDTFNGKVGETFTFVNNFRMIGQGPGNNFLVHETLHATVNANGVATVVHDNLSVECR